MNTKQIISVCLFSLLLSSCVSEEPPVADGKDDINVITATTAVATKTLTRDGVNVLWENKDAIVLRYQQNPGTVPVSCTYTTTLAAPKSTAVFRKNAGEENIPNMLDGKFIAFYPASVYYMSWAKKSNVVFALNPDQVAKDKGFDPSSAIMIASSASSEFAFRHVVSYIRFTVTSESDPFCKVTVTSGEETQYMVSRIRVNFDDDFSYSLETLNSSGAVNTQTKDYVSLTTSDNGDFLPGTYYVAINPDVYAKGLKFTFENSEGKEVTLTYDGFLEMVPGKVLDIGTVNSLADLVTLPYVSVYKKEGKKQGVVFYEDPADANKKKIISVAGDVLKWAISNDSWRISNYSQDYDYVHAVITSSDEYRNNSDNFPAVKFCEQMRQNHGGNWHVPSVDEMKILFNAYYGKPYDAVVETGFAYVDNVSRLAAAYFDGLLESAGGESMLSNSDEYWTCVQDDNGDFQFLNLNQYRIGRDIPTTERYMRCVLDVDENKQDYEIEYPQTDIGKLLAGGLAPKIINVTWDTTYNVTNGLDYYQMKVVTDANEKQDIYLLRTDPSKGLNLKVTISDESTSTVWYRKKLSEMVADLDSPSNPVYAMINADFCNNIEPINPRGPVHCDGTIWFSVFDLDPNFTHQGLSYVGVTSEGKMTIAPRDNYESAKNSLTQCTGAGVILLQNSEIQGGLVNSYRGRDPRTAIGYTPNNIVWMLAVDGRHGTLGMTYAELASIFSGLGCVAAANLDGGGSTQMLVRDPETGEIAMRNWPSDPNNGAGGQERPRLNAWAIVGR